MKIGSVIEYVTRNKRRLSVVVVDVVHAQQNKRGEVVTTMWVQLIRGTRRGRPIPFSVADTDGDRRVVGHGKVVAITD